MGEWHCFGRLGLHRGEHLWWALEPRSGLADVTLRCAECKVTISTCVCGFFPVLHTVIYVVLQIVGAIVGALVTAFLVPGNEVGGGNGSPGCFDSSIIPDGVTHAQACDLLAGFPNARLARLLFEPPLS